MKYKLIKSYPNSRETGTIVSPVPQPDTGSKTSRYVDSSGRYYGWHEVEDYPEYWEEIKEPTFKVGDWICDVLYPKVQYIVRIEEIIKTIADNSSYGVWYNIQASGISDDSEILTNNRLCGTAGCRLATKEEIEGFLIAEAKKRGFAKGVSYRYPDRPDLGIRKVESNEFGYNPHLEMLYDVKAKNGIYNEGKWAEIVKEEEIKIGEYIARFDFSNSGPNTVSFGCKKYTFSEIISLYETCLVFGVSQVYAHNHLVEWMTIKKIYDEIKKQR